MKYIKYLLCFLFISFSLFALTIEEENLFNAINEKNSQNVSSILTSSTNININVLDTNGYTPIHRAIYNNDLNTVNELLKNTNLNINSKLDGRVSIDGWYLGGATPLILASYLGYTNIAETLLNNNADIKARDDVDGSMAIHMAAANGNNDVIKILLSKDATIINETDNKGNTALHWASMKDKPETIKILVENGADIEAKDVDGWTSLHYASAFSSLQTVENLIDLGADVESRANDGSMPLSYAQKEEIRTYLAGKGNIERENNNGNDINEENIIEENTIDNNNENNINNEENNQAPIEPAETVESVIDTEESEEPEDNEDLDIKQLELLVAIKNKDIISINNLLKDGVNPNFQDEEGFSPLHRAIEINSLDSVNALLSYKDIDKEIKLPYETLSSDGWYLGGATPLLYASYLGNTQIVSTLIEAGCDIRARDDIDGAMPIHVASANGNDEVINLLLNKDKTLINETDDNGGDSALHWAAMKGKASTVEILVNYGADKKLKNEDGYTAADTASINGYEDIALFLGGSTYTQNLHYYDDFPVYKKKTDLSKKWWAY